MRASRHARRLPSAISTVSHRRLSHRVCMLVLLVAVLPALLMSLASCGGGGAAAETPAPPPAAQAPETLRTAGAGELLAYMKDRVRQRADVRATDPLADLDGPTSAPPLTFATAPSPAGTVASVVSATTVQEPGVDEPDLIESDGTLILAIAPRLQADGVGVEPQLRAWRRRADGSLLPTGAVAALPGRGTAAPVMRGLLYAEGPRRAAVLGESVAFAPGVPCDGAEACIASGVSGLPSAVVTESTVEVQLVAADAAGNLVAGDAIRISGRLVGARRVGDTLVVVSTHTPSIAADRLPRNASAAEREALLAQLRATDVLPTLRINDGAARPLLAETDCWLQPANASTGLQLTTVTTLDLSVAGAQPSSRCIVGGSEAVYLSSNTLVLATTRTRYAGNDMATTYPPQFRTDIHKLAFGAGGVAYRGSGSVEGHLGFDEARKPLRISEHAGDIRVLSFTGGSGWVATPSSATPPSPATLTVLRERADGTLQELARLPNAARPQAIGKPGEQVYGVRFIGDRAYVVTFRLIDPLYVIDLSNPADPRVAGSVEVPGVSETLFPVGGAGSGLLFGVGRNADANGMMSGLKFSLLDVADPAAPREIASVAVGNRFSGTGLDHALQAFGAHVAGATTRIAIPALVFTGSGVPGTPGQGLQRFEVDAAARALRTRPTLPSSTAAGTGLWTERSLQIGDDLYYLSNGELTRWTW